MRKYLLMLDTRKDHVKFWRPQMLLLVANPLSCCDLIDFINDVKKGGLYVLGHVKVGHFENERHGDPCQQHYSSWLSLVDLLKVKAFVELTMAPSVRDGMHHLIRISGLGGMKPNTICFGFYDHTIPVNSLVTRGQASSTAAGVLRRKLYTQENGTSANTLSQSGSFPVLRADSEDKRLGAEEYVLMLSDTFKMNKNVCVFRDFHKLNKEELFKSRHRQFIDVWPVNLFRPDTVNYFDNTCLFMLQLACILHMVPGWKKTTFVRVFMCIDEHNDETIKRKHKLSILLQQLRIIGQIEIVTWSHVTCLHNSVDTGASNEPTNHLPQLSDEYVSGINDLIRHHSDNTAVTFCYLPRTPYDAGTSEYTQYLAYLKALTDRLPPTIIVHGVHPVTSTTL